MKRELVDAVVAAIDTLIADELQAKDAGRYQRVAKLCGKASAVLQMAVTRVGQIAPDVEAPDHIMMMPDDYNVEGFVEPIRFGGGGNDTSEMLREMVTMTQKFMEKKTPRPAVSPTGELLDLLSVRDQLAQMGRDVSMVDARIDRALNKLNEGDTDAVVRAELSRGHQAGVDHGQALLPVRAEGHATGENGARGAGHAGGEEEVATGTATTDYF